MFSWQEKTFAPAACERSMRALKANPGGTVRIKHYLVGFDTKTGHIDIAYPYLRLDDAKVVAQKIATPIGGVEGTATTNFPAGWGEPEILAAKVLLWGGLSHSRFSRQRFWIMHSTMR